MGTALAGPASIQQCYSRTIQLLNCLEKSWVAKLSHQGLARKASLFHFISIHASSDLAKSCGRTGGVRRLGISTRLLGFGTPTILHYISLTLQVRTIQILFNYSRYSLRSFQLWLHQVHAKWLHVSTFHGYIWDHMGTKARSHSPAAPRRVSISNCTGKVQIGQLGWGEK